MAPKIPIDISAVLKEVTSIEDALNTPLSVSVYLDPTAPGDVSAFVRSAFASEAANTRLALAYVDDATLATVRPEDDLAVVVAGLGEWVGSLAARVRAAGVPAMVVTTLPSLVREAAAAFGAPVPDGDVVAPLEREGADMARIVAESVLEVAGVKEPAEGVAAVSPEEPIELAEEAKALLSARMGEWVMATCREKRLAFALAFPFVRRPLALDIAHANSMQNAGIGAVMFIPGADMPLMTLNQARMLLQIAAAYGKPMNAQRAKELALVVAGAFACRGVARQLAGMLPGLGWAAKAGVAFAGTEAMGRAAIEYFEAGGDAAGFANVLGKAGKTAAEAASRVLDTPAGRKAADAVKGAAWAVYDSVGAARR